METVTIADTGRMSGIEVIENGSLVYVRRPAQRQIMKLKTNTGVPLLMNMQKS